MAGQQGITDAALAALQLAAYDYPAAPPEGNVSFAWDWLCHLDTIRAGLKRVDDDQVIIMPGTGGGVNEAETLRQWALNFTALPERTIHPVFGWVFAGFYAQIEEFVTQLTPNLDPRKNIYIVGHSRGAAQAAYVAGLLKMSGITPAALVCLASPRPAGSTFASYLQGSGIHLMSYRNSGPDGHDLVTDVPFDIPHFLPACHITTLTDIHAEPLPGDKWGLLRFHHAALYASGIAALGM